MTSHKFTVKQTKYIVDHRLKGEEWDLIRDSFNEKFETKISSETIRRRYRASGNKPIAKTVSKKNTSSHPLANFTKEALGDLVNTSNRNQATYFVTAASPTSHLDYSEEDLVRVKNGEHLNASNVHVKGLQAIENFLKRKNAELVIQPMRAHVKALKNQPQHYDPILQKHIGNFYTEYTFNRRLKAIEAQLNPQQINPLTGLKRLKADLGTFFEKAEIGNKISSEIKRFKTSLIIAHSKQMMEVIPTGNSTHPRIIHSTGAITRPSYLKNRIGIIADQDHVLGGLIVEVEGDKFFLRQAQIDPIDGSFVDLGIRYHADGSIEEERAEAFKMGDLHPGYHDDKALSCIYEMWDLIKPKKIFYEDFFDGHSISHHMVNKNLSRQKKLPCFSTLGTECSMAHKVLYDSFDKAPKDAVIFATASNHPEHVIRYLEEGRYIKDDANYDIAHRMVVDSLDGNNPLKKYIDPDGRMIWLNENDDVFVEGVQMAAHGHLGVNGSRGGKGGYEMAYGNAMIAHSHTPGIFHQVFQVGHTSEERHGYNQGPGTWILCSGAVYRRGQKQLMMIIGREWRSKKSNKNKP